MNLVILSQEQFGQIRTILTSDSRDQSAFQDGSQDNSNSLSSLSDLVLLHRRSCYRSFEMELVADTDFQPTPWYPFFNRIRCRDGLDRDRYVDGRYFEVISI